MTSSYLEGNLLNDHRKILENITKNISSHYLGRLKSLEYLAQDMSNVSPSKANQEKIQSFLRYETLVSTVHVYDTQGGASSSLRKVPVSPPTT